MSAEVLAAWLLSIMLSAVPPGKTRFPQQARETAEAGKARYAAIAEAIAEVSLDPQEQPLFAGEQARLDTAVLLLTIAYHESHWRRDVDLGLGPRARGGGGRYHCMMQIAVDDERTPEGWTAKQLVQQRELCFRRALHILQRGKKYCGRRGSFAFVNHYASGYCDRGRRAVAKRLRTFRRFKREHPFPPPRAKKPAAAHKAAARPNRKSAKRRR